MKKWIMVMALAAGLMTFAAGCSGNEGLTAPGSDTATGSDTIKIGVRIDIKKWAYYDKESEIYSGAEVDYAKALGRELGFQEVELVGVTPENLKSSIHDKTVDCLVSKCTIMDTSEEEYEFSPAYYEDQGSFLVEKSSRINNLEGLVGKKTGLIKGSDIKGRIEKKMISMNLISKEDKKGTEFVEYDNYEEISDALEAGDIEAFAADRCILRAWQDQGREILSDTYQDKEYGVAALKDTALTEEIAQAVKALKEGGVMDQITARWYGGGEEE